MMEASRFGGPRRRRTAYHDSNGPPGRAAAAREPRPRAAAWIPRKPARRSPRPGLTSCREAPAHVPLPSPGSVQGFPGPHPDRRRHRLHRFWASGWTRAPSSSSSSSTPGHRRRAGIQGGRGAGRPQEDGGSRGARHPGRPDPRRSRPESWCPATWCSWRRATTCPPTCGWWRRRTCSVEEASLTGESVPVEKDPDARACPERRAAGGPLHDGVDGHDGHLRPGPRDRDRHRHGRRRSG